MARTVRAALLAATGLALVLGAAGPAAATGHRTPADPTPGGPVRPYEPDVAGPANRDTLTVTARASDTVRRGLSVTFDRTSRAEGGGVPAGARRFVFLFDRSLELHLDRFPTCAPATLATSGLAGCAPGSVVGRGVATAFGGAETPVVAVNTRYPDGLRGVLVHVPATGAILPNTLERVTGRYAKDYRWGLDELFPVTAVAPQDRPGTARFRLTFGAERVVAGTPVSLITRRGPDRSLRAGLWSEFVTGPVVVPQDRFRVVG